MGTMAGREHPGGWMLEAARDLSSEHLVIKEATRDRGYGDEGEAGRLKAEDEGREGWIVGTEG